MILFDSVKSLENGKHAFDTFFIYKIFRIEFWLNITQWILFHINNLKSNWKIAYVNIYIFLPTIYTLRNHKFIIKIREILEVREHVRIRRNEQK